MLSTSIWFGTAGFCNRQFIKIRMLMITRKCSFLADYSINSPTRFSPSSFLEETFFFCGIYGETCLKSVILFPILLFLICYVWFDFLAWNYLINISRFMLKTYDKLCFSMCFVSHLKDVQRQPTYPSIQFWCWGCKGSIHDISISDFKGNTRCHHHYLHFVTCALQIKKS
jgi:hypothetical protein